MKPHAWIGTRKGLFELTKNGGWKISGPHFHSAPVTMTLCDPRDRKLYAALNHGHFGVKLHRSDDNGANWKELPTPAYPEKPADYPAETSMMGAPPPWKLVQIWSLEPGGKDQPGRLWCGTLPGGLFCSEDHGESWTLNRSLWDHPLRREWFGGGADVPGLHSICVDPRNSRSVKIGVSCGGVFQTHDDGATWNTAAKGMRAEYMPPDLQHLEHIQDPHRMVQCPAAPDHLWVQHHNGVFRSTDNAATWTEIPNVPPSVFGFAVAVHPKDPLTAWTVPAQKDEFRVPVGARFTAARTRDGGRTWQTLSNGLPSQNAWDIVFRHCLDVDPTGSTLLMGSTTGNLWVSEDQGDNWQTLSHNLPPIYTIRWDP